MNAHSVLEPILRDTLEVIKPLREDWAVRSKIIEELKDVIASIESLRGATVEPFGSFVSNLFTRWGDLDISIMLANGSYISSAAKKRKQNVLREFHKALRQKGGWRRLQFVPNARVPLLKFESGRQNISCDVSIDNLQGQIKSNFLFWLNQIDGRFRDMVLLVKEWAKAHNINNPKTGTLNSYSLSLLVIFHFQTCVPAILPPLKEIYPRNVVDDLTGVRTVAEERIKETCNANIARYMSDKYRAVNRSSLSELFISFFAKFSGISLKAADLGICTFTGQWLDIRSTMRWLPKTYALFIEDPFEQPENAARAVSAGNLVKIAEAFQTTYHKLVLANQNRTSLLGTLVRPEILNCIAGTPVRNLSYTSLHYQSTHPQISKSMYSSPQVQHQFQNMRQEKHQKIFTAQRQEKHPHSSNSQYRVQNTRLEKHPSYLAKQGHESHPENTRLERHPNYFAMQKQESNVNTSTRKKPAQYYHGQGQQLWRPKSDGQGHFL
ncbi:zinc finger protein, putative [Ricinus communis]|uniref:Zinc finger protein, putative n=1 Tax=Ricinus communis TaxID=3988 RepID=B9SDZ7_RICCO|nr:zinc finger protein, putative [Ricinus communis]|eukprot:XP_002524216.1 protein HESO1 [Ricinus communis]